MQARAGGGWVSVPWGSVGVLCGCIEGFGVEWGPTGLGPHRDVRGVVCVHACEPFQVFEMGYEILACWAGLVH